VTSDSDMPKKEIKATGINWDAGEIFLRERGATTLFAYVAPDFDDPLPEDFLLKPLPVDRANRKR